MKTKPVLTMQDCEKIQAAARAEALLVALAGRSMTPQLARQAADTLLDPKSGFIRDVAVNMQGVTTVLALRSKFTGKLLGNAAKYVDPSYRDKALAR